MTHSTPALYGPTTAGGKNDWYGQRPGTTRKKLKQTQHLCNV